MAYYNASCAHPENGVDRDEIFELSNSIKELTEVPKMKAVAFLWLGSFMVVFTWYCLPAVPLTMEPIIIFVIMILFLILFQLKVMV